MEGIAYFKEYCQEQKIDPNKFFKLGRGTKYPNKTKKRYELKVNTSHLIATQLYAIQYCKDIAVYVAWSIKNKSNHFSIKASEIILPLGNKVCSVKKAIQYSGWDEELVLYFQKDGIPDFFERYIKERSEISR